MCGCHRSSLGQRFEPQELIISDHVGDYVGLVIAYKNHELLAMVLQKLKGQTQLPRAVLVVDNGGTLTPDDLKAMPLSDRTTLISRPDNPGYGAAVNEAAPYLEGDALLVLTHDALFGPNLATGLLSALESRPSKAGSAGPLLKFSENPTRVFSAGGVLSPGGRASHLPAPRSETPYPVDWLDGAIVMYRAEALERIGWISEEYFLYFEDVDTGWRLARTGLECLVAPQVIAYQQPGAHPMYLGIRNMALFSRKIGIPAWRQALAVIRRVSRESLSRLRHRKPLELGAAWRGWRDGRAGFSGKPGE